MPASGANTNNKAVSGRSPEVDPEVDPVIDNSTAESAGRDRDPIPVLAGLAKQRPRELGGPKGPDPVRYGDWERGGRCIDF